MYSGISITCKKCGAAELFHGRLCKPCETERKKKWAKDNKEKVNAANRQWRSRNKDKVKQLNDKYRAENREKIAAYKRQYYLANQQRIKDQSFLYYWINRDRILGSRNAYHAARRLRQEKPEERVRFYSFIDEWDRSEWD